MSKNITIQEGGVGKQLTVDKLKTNLVGGGTCLWLPEDEVALGRKTITENGTFLAADDGLYGYARVTVRGVGKAAGVDRDGDEASAKTTSDGRLVVQKLPSRIVVETLPMLTAYSDGEPINYRGMVVKAYLRSGRVWTDTTHPDGVIPLSELILPVTQAEMSNVHSDIWRDGAGINARMLTYTPRWYLDWKGDEVVVYCSEVVGTRNDLPAMLGDKSGPTQFLITRYNGDIYCMGSTAKRYLNGYTYDASAEKSNYSLFSGTNANTGTGPVVCNGNLLHFATGIPVSTVKPEGTPNLRPVNAFQTVPVQWERPEDDKMLETEFEITVVEAPES